MRLLNNRKGQTLVEFALVLPILLLLLLGIFEFGRIFNATLVLEHAARDAVRVGVVGDHKNTTIEAIIDSRTSTLDDTKLNVSISPAESNRHAGETLTVSLNYDIDLMTPMISVIVGNTLSLKGEASMRIE